ncbi:hypothetical protein Tco_0380641, partial [Tanacetum coccineum]
MADDRPMAEQLQAPTGGFESAIVIPHINAQNFELKSSLINLVQNRIFQGGSEMILEEEIEEFLKHDESLNIDLNDDFNDEEGDVTYLENLLEVLNDDP